MNLFKRILTVISIILIALAVIVIVIYATALSSETGDFPFLDGYVVASKVPERPSQNSKFIYESYDESKYNYSSPSISKPEYNSEPKAAISLSCPTNMEVGSSIVVTVSTTNLKGEYSLRISGTNLVDGYFVEGDEILFHANKNGSTTIYACSDYDPSIVSNKITISVTGNAIASADDLSKLRGSSSNYILVDDIDMSIFSTWEPIEGFTGTIDGKGHSIFNLTMVGKEEESSLGFFKDFSGTLKNISFENINIKTSSNSKNIGIVAGVIKGGKIEDVTVDGLVDTPYSESVGGFFGKYENGDILNCMNYAKVSAKSVVGGIVGELQINDLGNFTGNINYGTVSSSGEKVGGIVGYIYATDARKGINEKLFSGNKNEGTINGTKNVGGIVGAIEGYYKYNRYDGTYALKINVSTCSNTGKIAASGDYAGGIVGYGNNMNFFKGCINEGDVTGVNWVGGISGRTDATIYSNGSSNESSITGYAYLGGVAGECGGVSDATNNGNVIIIGSRLEEGVKVSNVGGIVGFCKGSIINCSNLKEIKSTSGGSCVGGVAGALECDTSSKIDRNSNSGNISSNGENTGGVFGKVYANEPSKEGTFEVSLSEINNKGNVNGTKNVGGIAGAIDGYYKYKQYDGTYSLKINILKCSNLGRIVASGDYVGGIIGYGNNMNSLKECTNNSDIKGINWVGGVAGRTDAMVYANGFSNKNTIEGHAYLGGVAGECGGISDASNTGNVVSLGFKLEDGVKISNVGGIIGFCKGSVKNCSNAREVKIFAEGSNVGGVVGIVECNTETVLIENSNTGRISSEGDYTGGVFGRVYACEPPESGTYGIEFVEMNNSGNVNGLNNVGGIAGAIDGYYKYKQYDGTYSLKVTVSNCTNTGKIISAENYVGGIIGYGNNMSTFKGCTNYGDISGMNWVGGVVGQTDAMIYANGFSNESSITGYAYLGGIAGECGGVSDATNNGSVITIGSRLEDGVKVSNVGGVIGLCRGSVENCRNLKEIKSTSGGISIGGVVGALECNTSTKINGNLNVGNVLSNGENTGGVFGKIYAREPFERGTYEVELVGTENKGTVNGTKNVGGIAGIIEGYYKYKQYDGTYSLKINIFNCMNTGRIIASNENQGSIVGLLGNQVEML